MTLTDEQRQAVEDKSEKSVIIASAGSGKTLTLAQKVNFEIARGVQPKDILAITFTKTGAEELKKRTDPRITASTLHSFAMRKNRMNPDNLISEADEIRLIHLMAKQHGIRGYQLRTVREAMELGDNARGDAGFLARAVMREIRVMGKFNFAEALLQFERGLQDGKFFNEQFELMLVDEAQDGNGIDERIYSQISAQRRVFVGDPRQAIFGFRGSSPRALIRMSRTLPQNCRYELSGSFRCPETVIRAANRVADRFSPVNSLTREQGNCLFHRFETEKQEFEAIFANLHSFLAKGQTCAVLCRYNRTVSAIKTELKRAGFRARKEDFFCGTIHKAKGGEWDHVFIPSCEELSPNADQAEEMRIFYVGITRTKRSLFVSESEIVTTGFDQRLTKPSPFFKFFS